ncbi:MAG TPA: LacI family DNA-binding transcriptional regulator [Clostridia bacterium]|nr:LacI family DNA-binding transcriptional regulator [Clostridia bacterium]
MKRSTIKDVAALAGVSVSTVSRVVNDHETVASDLRERVLEAMDELQFRPNVFAQSMRKSKKRVIGLVLPNLTDPFFGSIANHVIASASELGESVITCISHRGGNVYDEAACFEELSRHGIDGLIYCSIASIDPSVLQSYLGDLPLVICSRHDMIKGRPHVFFDHQQGGYLAIKHLIEMGHRRISLSVGVFNPWFQGADELEKYIEDPVLAGPFSGLDKFIGARRALEEFGVPYYPELVEFVDLGAAYETGYRSMQRLISRTSKFDAVFCSNDLSAIGAIHMLEEQRLSVPEDISVIGYDNGIMATSSQPQLSTVMQDTTALGRQCVHVLNKAMDGEPCADVLVDVYLIIRQSSCRHTPAEASKDTV